MSTYVQRVMIVPAQLVDLCRQLAASFESGSGMFTTPLSPTGQAPATHYVSSGSIWQVFADMLSSPENLSQGTGLPLEQAVGILSNCRISEGDPFALFDELGLKLCSKVEVNSATIEELSAAPGISSARASDIVEGRPWASIDDLSSVSGISATGIRNTYQHWFTL